MPHMEGIFINGEKAKFHPEDILDTDASQYTEEIGESVTAYLTEHITNPSNPPIDTSLSIAGAAADGKKTGDELNKLKDLTNSLGYGVEKTFNVTSDHDHSSKNDQIPISIKSGDIFTIYIEGENAPSFVQAFGYLGNTNTDLGVINFSAGYKSFTANANFDRIGLYTSKSNSDYSVTFSVTVSTGLVSRVNELEDRASVLKKILIELTKDDFERGSYEVSNGKVGDTRRLRLREGIDVVLGDIVKISASDLYYSINVYADSSYSSLAASSGWLTGSGEPFEYVIPVSGYMTILVGNASNWDASTDIVLNDFDADYIHVFFTMLSRYEHSSELIEHFTSSVTTVIASADIEQGSYENGSKTSSNVRIRTKNRVRVYENDLVFISNPSNKPLLFYMNVFETEQSTTPIQQSGWIKTPFLVTSDGYATVVFANGQTYDTSTNITLSDFEGCSLTIVHGLKVDIDNRTGMHVNIGSNHIPTITYSPSQGVRITIPLTTLTYLGTNTGYGYAVFSASDIASQLGSTYFEYDENNMTFIIPSSTGVLYFDTKTLRFGVVSNTNVVGEHQLVLVANWYGNLHGDWIYKVAYEQVNQIILPAITDISIESQGTPYYSKIEDYCKFMYGDVLVSGFAAPTKFENFLWFTDPHTMYGKYTYDRKTRTHGCAYFDKYVNELEFVYNSTPTDFVLCGGDWNDGGIPAEELFKLSRAMETCKAKLAPFYNCVGNHDTNYQGKADAESESYTSRFSPQCIKDLWYRDQEECYFTFEGRNTKFYCFNTGIENQALTTDDNYLSKQIKWFAQSLTNDNSTHIALAMHIYYYTGTTIQAFTDYVMKIACAYNAKTTYTFDGVTYDYSQTTGNVDFVMAGHSHRDFETSYSYANETIPVIATVNAGNANANSNSYYGAPHCIFDLVHVDYDNREIHLVRIGHLGSNRTVSF